MSESVADGQPYLFISYASSDRERVLPIVAALTAVGIHVWRDQDDIASGMSYGPAIASAIRGSAAVLILCSDASLTSRNVRQEMAIAWKHERPYLPLLLDPVTTLPEEVEYWLEGAQWIEVLDQSPDVWLPKVVAALTRVAPAIQPIQPSARTGLIEESDLAAADPALTSLPTPLTALVGRQVEIEQIHRLLDRSRLVTLIGPGGTGKTRLALEVGHTANERFADGVIWVDLSPLRDPALVMPTLATTLGVQAVSQEPILSTLMRAIGSQHLLLVADNWEQVIEAAADLGALLRACPHLHVLATSRVALRISGEREMPIEPLAVPDDDVTVEGDLAILRRNEAVRLFVDRAEAVKPGFTLTTDNAPAVVGICRHVEGLPLAIELAAARIKVLSPQVIFQRLEHSLNILTGGARDVAERQRAMRNTIEWSFDLLSPEEQRLMRRLSVFVGGWTLGAAEAVTDIDGDFGVAVLDEMMSLVEKNLVLQHEQADGSQRYRLLAPIREYASEQLERHDEVARLRQRHAEVMRALCEDAYPFLRVFDSDWLDRIDLELDNIRAALTWSDASREPEIGLSIAGSLTQFWFTRGYLDEGRRWADAFRHHADLPIRLRARASLTSGMLATTMSDLDAAERALGEAVRLSRSIDDAEVLAEALVFTAEIHFSRQPPDDAAVLATHAEAFSLIDKHQLDWLLVICLNDAGLHERLMGRLDRAEEFFSRQDAITRAKGWTAIQTWAQVQLAATAHARGLHAETLRHLREALRLNHGGRNRLIGFGTLDDIAQELAVAGNHRAATRLFAVVDREWRTTGAKGFRDPVTPEAIQMARDYLDPQTFEVEWEIGRRLSLQDAIAFALSVTDDESDD